MSSTILSETILMVAVIVAASIFSVIFISNFQLILGSQQEKIAKSAEKMETKIEVIFADALQFNNTVKAWVKNIGQKSIPEQLIGSGSDVFLKERNGTTLRVPFNAETSPSWSYTLNGDDDEWDPGETLEITINLPDGVLDAGDWIVRFVTYNGAYSSYIFSL